MSLTRLRCIRCKAGFDYDHPKSCHTCGNNISPKLCISCHNRTHYNHARPLVNRYRRAALMSINIVALFTYVSLAIGAVRLFA